MKKLSIITFILLSFCINAQTAQDLFSPKQVNVTWLGVDFSHIKIFGKVKVDEIKEYLPVKLLWLLVLRSFFIPFQCLELPLRPPFYCMLLSRPFL